jgi:hypothetical protein
MLTVYGLAESDRGDKARQVAQAHGLRVQPDPQPLRNVFIRSDRTASSGASIAPRGRGPLTGPRQPL